MPTAICSTICKRSSIVRICSCGHVALWAKRHPLPAGSLAPTKLNQTNNANFFKMLILEPLQLTFRLVVVLLFSLKCCPQTTHFKLQIRHLSFQVSKLVLSEGKLLAENRRRTVLCNQFFNAIEKAHESQTEPKKLPGQS